MGPFLSRKGRGNRMSMRLSLIQLPSKTGFFFAAKAA
jgi:hypothetical protein